MDGAFFGTFAMRARGRVDEPLHNRLIFDVNLRKFKPNNSLQFAVVVTANEKRGPIDGSLDGLYSACQRHQTSNGGGDRRVPLPPLPSQIATAAVWRRTRESRTDRGGRRGARYRPFAGAVAAAEAAASASKLSTIETLSDR